MNTPRSSSSDVLELVDFDAVVGAVRRSRLLVVACALAFAAALVGISYTIVPAYRATIIVTPVNNDAANSARSGAAGQLGGIAALAGFNLGGVDTKDEYLAYLQSRGFIRSFIATNRLLSELSFRDWVLPVFGSARYDEFTDDDAVRRFGDEVMSVDENKKTRIVTISIVWRDRNTAARWADGVVAAVNEHLRARAIRESDTNLAFLNAELQKTNVVALQQALGRLIENEARAAMLARGREQYAFRVVDPASVPDRKDKVRPKRAMMAALGFMFGGFAGALLAVARGRRAARRDAERNLAS